MGVVQVSEEATAGVTVHASREASRAVLAGPTRRGDRHLAHDTGAGTHHEQAISSAWCACPKATRRLRQSRFSPTRDVADRGGRADSRCRAERVPVGERRRSVAVGAGRARVLDACSSRSRRHSDAHAHECRGWLAPEPPATVSFGLQCVNRWSSGLVLEYARGHVMSDQNLDAQAKIAEIRQRIDQIDCQLVGLLNERAQCSLDIRALKPQAKLGSLRPEARGGDLHQRRRSATRVRCTATTCARSTRRYCTSPRR